MKKPKRLDSAREQPARPFGVLFWAGRTSPHSGRMRNIVALLANLHDPGRLIGHPYVTMTLRHSKIGPTGYTNSEAAVRAIRTAAFDTLDRMRDNENTRRLYSVISSCDVRGCEHKKVAHELGLSRRQFYRDLHSARLFVESALLERIRGRPQLADNLSSIAGAPSQTSARLKASSHSSITVGDPLRLELLYIRSLEQVGDFEAASNRLRALVNDTDDLAERSLLLSALSGSLLEQGIVDAAREHCDRAARDAAASGDPLAIGEAETAQARMALSAGDILDSDAMLRRSISRLRPILDTGDRILTANALARALITRADVEILLARYRSAEECAIEAENKLCTCEHSDRLLRVSARISAAAATGFLRKDPATAESEMRACYDAAIEAGFIAKAIEAGVVLATMYRLHDRVDQAAEFLRSILPIARRISLGNARLSYFISLANALAAIGEAQAALDALVVASGLLVPNQKVEFACFNLALARAYLGVGRTIDAIQEAKNAEVRLEKLGLTGYLGASLHVQANGLIALGRRSEALKLSYRSVEALSAGGHPDALRAAKATLGSLRVGTGTR